MNGVTLFQAFPVVGLLGFMDGLAEGYRPPMFGDLLQSGRPAIGEHEPTPNRVKSSLFGLPR